MTDSSNSRLLISKKSGAAINADLLGATQEMGRSLMNLTGSIENSLGIHAMLRQTQKG